MPTGSGIRVAVNAAAAATIIASDFAPVPYLSAAVGIVVGILQLCENVRVNKYVQSTLNLKIVSR